VEVSAIGQTRGERPRYALIVECPARIRALEAIMLMTILLVLGILWLLGFSLNVGGGLIHMLLVVAAIVFVVSLLSGRRLA
jgi:hypothetical protein